MRFIEELISQLMSSITMFDNPEEVSKASTQLLTMGFVTATLNLCFTSSINLVSVFRGVVLKLEQSPKK
jgi:hypothetical protein